MRIEDIVERCVADGEVPGMNVLVLQRGNDLIYHQAGWRDVDACKPFDRDTIIRLYSMTKPVIGAAAMLLMERGEITLGEPLDRYFPAFEKARVCSDAGLHVRRRPIYLKDLLCMTSGLAYPADDPAFQPGQDAKRVYDELDQRLYSDDAMTTQEFAERFAECALAFEPGSSWMYGTGADIMGAVIEKVTGETLAAFLREEFFAPLGMCDTGFYCEEAKQDRLAVSYDTEKRDGKWQELSFDHLGIKRHGTSEPAFQSGGAGLYSTLDDYARFARMLLNGGELDGRRYLAPETVAFFTGGGLTPWQREAMWKNWDSLAGYDYGNFMRVAVENGSGQFPVWKGEYGWDGWLGNFFMNVPSLDLIVLIGVQLRDGGAFAYTQRIRNLLYTDPGIKKR